MSCGKLINTRQCNVQFERSKACNFSAHVFLPMLFGVCAGIIIDTSTKQCIMFRFARFARYPSATAEAWVSQCTYVYISIYIYTYVYRAYIDGSII